MVQLISRDPAVSERLMSLPLDSVVQVRGTVNARKQKAKTEASPSDGVEVEVSEALLLNPAESNLPFYPNRPELVGFTTSAVHSLMGRRTRSFERSTATSTSAVLSSPTT